MCPESGFDDDFDFDDDDEDICEECGANLGAGDDHEADCSDFDDDGILDDDEPDDDSE
jgi:hypothetical protein